VTRRPNGDAAEADGTTEAKEKGGPTGHSRSKTKMEEFTM